MKIADFSIEKLAYRRKSGIWQGNIEIDWDIGKKSAGGFPVKCHLRMTIRKEGNASLTFQEAEDLIFCEAKSLLSQAMNDLNSSNLDSLLESVES